MNIGNIIKQLRKAKGIKQKEFADSCEITAAYLSQIENNLREPNISVLKKISSLLEVPLPILFFLALEKDDVQEEKQEAFELISPAIKNLVNDLFIPHEST